MRHYHSLDQGPPSHLKGNRFDRDGGPRRLHGFTLIELLLVISIVTLLISLLLPALSSARKAGDSVRCKSNLRQISLGLQYYLQDNNERFPLYTSNGADIDWYKDVSLGSYYGGQQMAAKLRCRGAVEYPDKGWQLSPSSDEPTWVVNVDVIAWPGRAASQPAEVLVNVKKPDSTFVFADGNLRGVFSEWDMTVTLGRIYWYTHFGGANVAYLGGHVLQVEGPENPTAPPDRDWYANVHGSVMWE